MTGVGFDCHTSSGSKRCGRLGSFAGAADVTCTDAALIEALDRNVALSKLTDDDCRPGAHDAGQEVALCRIGHTVRTRLRRDGAHMHLSL